MLRASRRTESYLTWDKCWQHWLCKLVLATYLSGLLVLTLPQKNEVLSCPHHLVQLHICKQAAFPRVSVEAVERIPWLAAAEHRPEELSAAQPMQGLAAHHRVKVQSHEVSQLGSQWGLLLFTLGEDGGLQGRRESLPHVLPSARHPPAACSQWFMQLLHGVWFQGMWAAGAGEIPRLQTRDKTERKISPLPRVVRDLTRKYFVSLTFPYDSSPKDPG